MPSRFDKWTVLKIFEVGFAVACLISKRLTDDEASRLFLYLQKLSREWSLLNNVTWDRIGAAVADATYGGYVIITAALLIGRIAGELPTTRRISEMVFLGLGALLFVVLGSLEFAALDSVPPDLVDNAAILGTLSLITAALFLLDLGGPKAKKAPPRIQVVSKTTTKPEKTSRTPEAYEVEAEMEKRKKSKNESVAFEKRDKKEPSSRETVDRGLDETDLRHTQNGYTKMKEKSKPEKLTIVEKTLADKSRFGIYGKDIHDDKDSDNDLFDDSSSKTGLHSPVWSNIRKGQYGKYDIVSPAFLYPEYSKDERRSPSGPGDPGYVQYTAQRWGQQKSQKTPRHSPTEV